MTASRNDVFLNILLSKYRPHIVISAIGLALAAILWPVRTNFPFDDTFITFRYAANIAHGLGLVWNAGGPPTEGYTNFLYIILLAPFSAAGWDLVVVSQIIDVIAVIATGYGVWGLGYRVGGRSAALLAVALLYLDPFTWFNAFSGMETSLFAMWVVLGVLSAECLVLSNPRLKLVVVPFVFATLATLTRPEGGILFVILAIIYLRNAKNLARSTQHLALFVLPLAIYAIWKLYYFGDLLPNSFYVKVAQAGQHLPGRGAMRIYYESVWYLVVPALYVVFRTFYNRKQKPDTLNPIPYTLAAWCAGITAFYMFSVLIMNFYDRFMYSVEVCLIVLAAMGLTKLFKNVYLRLAIVAIAVLWCFTNRGGWDTLTAPSMENAYAPLERTLESIPHREQITLCWSDAGYLPYYTQMLHIDPVGLNTTAIARAHSWQQVNHLVAQARPDMIFVPYYTNSNVVFRDAHGLIAKGYPTLMQEPELATDKDIAVYHYPIYDIRIFADTLAAHYPDIKKAFGQ